MKSEALRGICAGFLMAECLGMAFAGDGNEWPQFRGPGGSGIAQDPQKSGIPTEWDMTNNVAWRTDVPGLGWSSPIVWGNRVFLTTAVDAQGTEQPEEGFYLGKDRGGSGEHRWLVLACDLNTGAKLWERQVHRAVPPRTHLKSSYASATPVTDGERVYAWFGEFGLLVALNVADGAQVWSFSEPPRKSRENWGFGASPVMHGGRVYLVHDNEEDAYVPSFLVAAKYLYVIKDIGVLSCYDAVTGASLYEERLRGHFTASPWMCGDKLFFLNERGDTYVVQAGPTFRILATNTLERLCLASPAVAGDRLLIRTSARLYCIGRETR